MSNPTFPIVQPPGAIVVSEGMTLRDAFAIAALPVAAAHMIDNSVESTVGVYSDTVAVLSYMVADAMMAARAAGAEPEAE